MSFAAIRSGEPIPIFDGTYYPYWKDKMMRNIISIDLNAWNIVENGVMVLDKDNLTEAEKKDLIIDNQVSLFITNHLVPNKYHEVKNIPSAKGVWEYLEKIVEGKSTQKEARIDILRSKFHRFKRHEGEKVNSIYNRLVALANELESLGAKDVDPHMVVRMLLRSLDESFSHVILMIKERSDYRKMVPADVLERLTTFEKEEDEKREINGTRRRTHALKAKASKYSSSEGRSESGTDSDCPSDIGKELALLVKRFGRFQRKNSSSSPKKNYSSKRSSDKYSSKKSSSKENCCYKCKKPGHFIVDCPLWEVENKSKSSHSHFSSKSHRSSKNYEHKKHESRSRRDKKSESGDEKKKKHHKSRESSSSKYHSSRRKNSHRAKAYLGKEMNSEDEASGSGSDTGSKSGSGSESDGVAGLAFASSKAPRSFFTNHSSDVETPAFCFMAKASKVSSKSSYDTTDSSAYETDAKLSYAKLAKIATQQQDELESLSLTMQKSETLLINEIEKGQTLSDEHAALKEKYDELSARHDLLTVNHEKLNYEFLQRKIALEKLKEAHEELETLNLTLIAQQGTKPKTDSTTPCLTCLDRDKLESVRKGKRPIVIDDSNPSVEENENFTEELLRLKDLFDTGMFKSVQGHQHLCDILRKALLHRNPRQEGVGFERKINPDGTYWAPEQYPRTVWVLAKEKPIDIANLLGFNCKIDKAIVDESLDSDYKLTKDQAGKVSAECVCAPPENGFYKRQIWVHKSLVEKLPANHSMQGKPTVPPRHFYSLEERNDPLVPESNIPQKEYYRVDRTTYRHRDNHDKIAISHRYVNPSSKNYVYGVLDGSPRRNYSARKTNVASTSTSAPSQSPARLWVVKKN